MSRMVSFSVLVGIIAVIGFLFYQVMIAFLLPLFLAAILVLMFRPLHRWFLVKCKGRPRLAAGLTTAAVMLIVLAPATYALTTAAIEASALVGRLQDTELTAKLEAKRRELGLQMAFPDELRFFEVSFRGLAERTSGGVIEKIDNTALRGLQDSLEAFQEKLEAEDKELVDDFESVVESFDAGMSSVARGASVETHRNFQDAAARFQAFKVELLGGRFGREYTGDPAADEQPEETVAAKLVKGVLTFVDQKELTAGLVEIVNPTDAEIEGLRTRVLAGASSWFRTIGGATGELGVKLIFGMLIVVISLHFFLCDGPAMVTTFMRLSPLDDRHEKELLDEFDRVSRAVVVATLLSAVVQGLLGGLGYWFADVGSVFLLTVLTTVFALIPFVGAAAVWVPVCLYLVFFEERYLAGGLLAVYGTVIVSMADNVIKPLVLHGQSNLHPLLALLSVLGGVQALGPIGVLVGPMVVAFLQTLLNILQRELTTLE